MKIDLAEHRGESRLVTVYGIAIRLLRHLHQLTVMWYIVDVWWDNITRRCFSALHTTLAVHCTWHVGPATMPTCEHHHTYTLTHVPIIRPMSFWLEIVHNSGTHLKVYHNFIWWYNCLFVKRIMVNHSVKGSKHCNSHVLASQYGY